MKSGVVPFANTSLIRRAGVVSVVHVAVLVGWAQPAPVAPARAAAPRNPRRAGDFARVETENRAEGRKAACMMKSCRPLRRPRWFAVTDARQSHPEAGEKNDEHKPT